MVSDLALVTALKGRPVRRRGACGLRPSSGAAAGKLLVRCFSMSGVANTLKSIAS